MMPRTAIGNITIADIVVWLPYGHFYVEYPPAFPVWAGSAMALDSYWFAAKNEHTTVCNLALSERKSVSYFKNSTQETSMAILRRLLRSLVVVYVAVSLALPFWLPGSSLSKSATACVPTGNYVLSWEPLDGCDSDDDLPPCDCHDHSDDGTMFSGWDDKMVASPPASGQTGEPANPAGGSVPCTKTVACEFEDSYDLTCKLQPGGSEYHCTTPLNFVITCRNYVSVIPNSWESETQASTCD